MAWYYASVRYSEGLLTDHWKEKGKDGFGGACFLWKMGPMILLVNFGF